MDGDKALQGFMQPTKELLHQQWEEGGVRNLAAYVRSAIYHCCMDVVVQTLGSAVQSVARGLRLSDASTGGHVMVLIDVLQWR